MYQFTDRLHTLYGLLQDEKSREIFLARFAVDMDPTVPNVRNLVRLGDYKDVSLFAWPQSQVDALRKLSREQKKIILYGAGFQAPSFSAMLQSENIDFYGFCGRNAAQFPDGLLGKPVITPDELVAHPDEYYVVPAVGNISYPEIYRFLREHNYPEDHMLGWADSASIIERQYFEFPALYRRGTAFVDGGSYDCASSYKFAKWCGGEYSSIIAFEPDPDNYIRCRKKLQDAPLPNVQLINAGMSSREGTAVFSAQNSMESQITSADLPSEFNFSKVMTENDITIRTVTIDGTVGDRTVGFIKMDIEGAELDALHGAKNTIVRDKPLLAISVYHLRGDEFAIMDYLHQLLPEYRFMLRHYSTSYYETILYASVDL